MTDEPRRAGPDDADAVGRLFAAAFADDPVMSWVYSTTRTEEKLRAMFGFLVREVHVPEGEVTVIDGGAASWTPPGPPPWSDERGAAFGAEVAAVADGDDLARLRILGEMTDAQRPTDEHWYLGVLAVDPRRRGRGLGTRLLRATLPRVDDLGLPAFLESTNPRNNPLYERHGFEVVDEVVLDDGPPFWPMLRPARPRHV